MTAAPLVPCDACARHLRADESRCPFCDAPHTPRALAYAPLPRVSRAALAALGAVLTVVPAAAVLTSHEAQAQRGITVVPAYGVPPPVHRAPDAAPRTDAGVDAGPARAPDAGVRRSAPQRRRTRRVERPEHIPVPLYGVAPKPE